jgi:methylenetetrahydrofolate dehydrogenase (NADP+)/methenyltetrahydrofolate cyclohydrolase
LTKNAKLLDGKAIAANLRAEIATSVKSLQQSHNKTPGLAVILVGDDPASEVYVRNKRRACEEVGIYSEQYRLEESTTQDELLELVDKLNKNPDIDGILVQLPLPEHINDDLIVESIATAKDVDGFHPYNIGRLAIRRPTLRSCTPWGVIKLLEATLADTGETLHGKEAVVVGASNHVGRPMTLELMLAGCTTTTCHRFTKDLKKHVASADILVVAVGKPGIVQGEWIKPGATVIDVGINRLDDGRLVGDIEYQEIPQQVAWITPVPGGVGPMTVAMLLQNTLIAAKKAVNAED